jgi:SAM-dependent methyltransferase
MTAPPAREAVDCYLCGSPRKSLLTHAVDDLGGRPGRFTFHTCDDCGFAYQDPRVPASEIGAWYDDAYIAHRRNADFGLLTPLYRWVMGKHDRAKQRLVGRFVRLDDATRVLDVGCAAGTFLALLRARYGCRGTGVDFKDLSDAPAFQHVDFVRGSFADVDLPAASFDLVTLWHYLEHDYDPPAALARCRTLLAREGRLVIEVPCLDSRTARWYGARWPGLQAPQHTVLFSQEHLQRAVRAANLEVVAHLPYGAFPPWFYVYAGWRFRRLAGRGFVPRDELLGYLLGQALCAPWLACAGRRNLAMQTVVCRRAA